MKYGQVFQERSVLQWAPYNIDYDELKHLIRVNTTRDQGQAIAIPGQEDGALQKFENLFFAELYNQHERVDLFVKSKTDEFSRRLLDYQKRALDLMSRSQSETGRALSARRRERYSKLESKIMRCGEDIRNMERFVNAQRTGFQKILKKYKKWTGSSTLGMRFTDVVLSSPKSFTRRDFEPLYNQYTALVSLVRDAIPVHSETSTPTTRSRQESRVGTPAVPQMTQIREPQNYWNEYDNGSEGDPNEPYTIYIDPDGSSFPGAKTVVYVLSRISSGAKGPFNKVRGWLSPKGSPEERQPLNPTGSGYFGVNPPSSPTETDPEDDASSSDFPRGYSTHYATFPSISDQKLSQYRDLLLVRSTIGCFLAAFLMLGIAGVLLATGRHRLRVEVDAAVTVGVVASLFFATLGFAIPICRWGRLGWLHRSLASASFLFTCILSGMLLVLVMGNTRL